MKKNNSTINLPVSVISLITPYLSDDSVLYFKLAVMQKSVFDKADKKILSLALNERYKYMINQFSLLTASINQIAKNNHSFAYYNKEEAELWGFVVPASPESHRKDFRDYQNYVKQLVKLTHHVPVGSIQVSINDNILALSKFYDHRLNMFKDEARYQLDGLFLPLNFLMMLCFAIYFSILKMSDADSSFYNKDTYAYASGFATAIAVLVWRVLSVIERYQSMQEKVSLYANKIREINELKGDLSSALADLNEKVSNSDQSIVHSEGFRLM